jgi:hypothetical protein
VYAQCLTGHSSMSFVCHCSIWSSISPFFCSRNIISTLSAMRKVVLVWCLIVFAGSHAVE